VSAAMGYAGPIAVGEIAADCVWRVFILAVLSSVGAIVAELKLPDPDLE